MAKPLRPGQLNPILYSSKTPIASRDKITDNPMGVYTKALSNLMNPNVFEGVTQYKAQVLLATKAKAEDNPFWKLIKTTFLDPIQQTTPPEFVYCICRIPELHQSIPDPNLYEDGDPIKTRIIFRHPIFQLNMVTLGLVKESIPAPGSIVEVKFFDPLYRNGEVVNILANNEGSNPFVFNARDSFLTGQQANGPLGDNQAIWFTPTNGREIKQIVLHITAGRAGPGRAQATIDYFSGKKGTEISNGKRKVSVHYAIDQNGTVVQGVEEKDIAYHAGNANAKTIGIEMCGNPGIDDGSEYTKNIGGRAGNWPPGATGISAGKGYLGKYAGMYTKELIEGVAKLCAEICDRNNIEINRQNIIGHEDLKPGSKWGPGESLNKRYPDGEGKYWNWDDFLSRVKGYSSQVDRKLVEELYGL